MGTQSDRTGILIVRLWIEGDAHGGFRARITQTLDSASREQTTTTAAVPEGLYAVIRTWVEAFVESGSHDRSNTGTRHPVTFA